MTYFHRIDNIDPSAAIQGLSPRSILVKYSWLAAMGNNVVCMEVTWIALNFDSPVFVLAPDGAAKRLTIGSVGLQ